MSPNLGQAACVAMTNAVRLAVTVSNAKNLDFALRGWEGEMRPIADRVQKYSRVYGRVGTHWPSGLLDARSTLVKRFTRSRKVQGAINFAAEHYPAGHIA
jgi:2-polyprenyl-6-methoxyphenol hydroxylase-like FAD-dependent oxidoreductase